MSKGERDGERAPFTRTDSVMVGLTRPGLRQVVVVWVGAVVE